MKAQIKYSLLSLSSAAMMFFHPATATEYTLKYGEWELISLPDVLPEDMWSFRLGSRTMSIESINSGNDGLTTFEFATDAEIKSCALRAGCDQFGINTDD